MNQLPRSLHMEKLANARDLGGIRAADGRTVAESVLLRTAALAEASPQDLECLLSEYRVKTILDLRSEDEIRQRPDPVLPGVRYVHIRIMDETLFEDDRDVIERVEQPDLKAIAASLLKTASENDMSALYAIMLKSDVGKEGFRRFFREILATEEGAVLWHCSAGKDRTGLGAALLLTALGADRRTILEDYMLTNDYCRGRHEAIYQKLLAQGFTKEQSLTAAGIMEGVSEDLLLKAFAAIEADNGTAEGYLKNQLGLTEDDLETLRRRYLR